MQTETPLLPTPPPQPAPGTSDSRTLCSGAGPHPVRLSALLTSTSVVLALQEVMLCEALAEHSSEPQFPQMSLGLCSASPAASPPSLPFSQVLFASTPSTSLTAGHMLLLLMLSHFSHVRLCVTPQTAAHQALPSLGFSRQESGVGCHFLLRRMHAC